MVNIDTVLKKCAEASQSREQEIAEAYLALGNVEGRAKRLYVRRARQSAESDNFDELFHLARIKIAEKLVELDIGPGQVAAYFLTAFGRMIGRSFKTKASRLETNIPDSFFNDFSNRVRVGSERFDRAKAEESFIAILNRHPRKPFTSDDRPALDAILKHFFNKTPYKALALEFGMSYRQLTDRRERLIERIRSVVSADEFIEEVETRRIFDTVLNDKRCC